MHDFRDPIPSVLQDANDLTRRLTAAGQPVAMDFDHELWVMATYQVCHPGQYLQLGTLDVNLHNIWGDSNILEELIQRRCFYGAEIDGPVGFAQLQNTKIRKASTTVVRHFSRGVADRCVHGLSISATVEREILRKNPTVDVIHLERIDCPMGQEAGGDAGVVAKASSDIRETSSGLQVLDQKSYDRSFMEPATIVPRKEPEFRTGVPRGEGKRLAANS